jgi:hypothetical protein
MSSYNEISRTMDVIAQDLPAREYDNKEFGLFFQSILTFAGIALDKPNFEDGNETTLLFDEKHGSYATVIIEQEKAANNDNVAESLT